MNVYKRFSLSAALCALLSFSLPGGADEMQDASNLFKQGQSAQALEKINAFLAGKPKDAQGRFLKGLIVNEQGNTNEAIKIFTDLTGDYPELPEPYNNLAVLLASQGQYDKARQALEMAIRTHPSYATAHENLGDIYAKMASQAYDRALKLDRSNAATQTKLAMIQDLFADDTRGKAAHARSNPVLSKSEGAAPAIAAETGNILEPAAPVAMRLTPAEKSAGSATDKSSEVLATVNAWAAAWSSQNVDSYLSFYADDFNTPGGESRTAWSAVRKERISAPKSIHIDISNATVKFNDSNHATVKFRQSYKANHLKASGNKTLLMVKSGDRWLIQEERAR
ncbi:MAG: tetratricopeptide repeat protein [Nitrosomonadales bacterium]|nr:tetratricopeptide repeat protein [Nitrosomonadales bacterium]